MSNEPQEATIASIKHLAENNSEVDVLWLYGSRARGNAQHNSDYDLAIAFTQYIKDPVERRLRPELLALEWNKLIGASLSIVDINEAPLPLAYAIVQDNMVIYNQNNYRRMTEEQIIMSKWELDHLYHRRHYA